MSDSKTSSTSNLIFFGLLAALLAIYLFVLRPLNRGVQGERHPAIGATLPEFSVDALDSNDQPIKSRDLAGKIVLINFWATWCGPCQQEFPHIVAIAKKFRDNADFRMVSIASPGAGETEAEMREATKAYLEQRDVDMPVYVDPYSAAFQAIVRATAASGGIPLTVVVDRQGVIRGIWEGYAPGTEREIEQLIESLLSASAPTGRKAASSRKSDEVVSR